MALDVYPPNSDVAVGAIDAGCDGEYVRADLGSFVRRHRWTEDARHRIPFSPERFDEDADAMARAIRELRLHVEALEHQTITAVMERIVRLESQQNNLTQMRIDLDAAMTKNAQDITRAEIVALLSGGIDAGNVDLIATANAAGAAPSDPSTDSGLA